MEFLIIYGLGIVVATIVGGNKGRGFTGFFLGLLFSWLGVIAIAVIPKKKREE